MYINNRKRFVLVNNSSINIDDDDTSKISTENKRVYLNSFTLFKQPLSTNKITDSRFHNLNLYIYILPIAIISTIILTTCIITLTRKYLSRKLNKSLANTSNSIEDINEYQQQHHREQLGINEHEQNIKYGTYESYLKHQKSEEIREETVKESKFLKLSLSWPGIYKFFKQSKIDKNQVKTELNINEIDRNLLIHKKSSQIEIEMQQQKEQLQQQEPPVINYTISYENNILKIHIISVSSIKNLKNFHFNPYVKIELVAQHDEKEYFKNNDNTDDNDEYYQFKACKTRILRNTQNPYYDETFKFTNIKNLLDFKLVLNVYSSNLFTRDLFVGECLHEFDVCEENKCFLQKYSKELNCVKNSVAEDTPSFGEISLSLSYKSETKTIELKLVKANHLPFITNNNLPNPFIRLYLFDKTERMCKKQSKILMQTRNPIFNQTFEFKIDQYELDGKETENNENVKLNRMNLNDITDVVNSLQIVMLIFDWSPLEKCEIISKLVLSNSNTVNEIRDCWLEMFNKPNEEILAAYKLTGFDLDEQKG